MPKRMTQEEFIKRMLLNFGDKYDYSDVSYKNYNTPVKITCPNHGPMIKKAGLFLDGNGCRKCYEDTVGKRCRMTTNDFIEKAIKKHGDKYDYSMVEYRTAQDKVNIICEIHGVFKQKASAHLYGYGCSHCGLEVCRTHKKDSLDDFISKAKSVHGHKYSFEKTVYINSQTKIIVTCKSHGDFKIKPNDIVNGVGCSECAKESGIGRWSINKLTEDQKKTDCTLYHVEITDGNRMFYKVGVTIKSIAFRFRNLNVDGFSYRVVSEIKDTLENCLDMEKLILDDLNSDGMLYRVHDLKGTRTGGWTECFLPINHQK